jgi:hypothetical protein
MLRVLGRGQPWYGIRGERDSRGALVFEMAGQKMPLLSKLDRKRHAAITVAPPAVWGLAGPGLWDGVQAALERTFADMEIGSH